MSKKLTITFHMKNPARDNTGLKFVLWEILIPPKDKEEPTIIHDWGFGEWSGKKWEALPNVPSGYQAVVCRWADTPHPDELLKEKSKIISLPGLN